MDKNITRLRAQDAAGEVAKNPQQSPAARRGQYEIALIEVVRTVARFAAQHESMTAEQLQTMPFLLDPASPLAVAARKACVERGFLADGSMPRFGFGDRREDLASSVSPSASGWLQAGEHWPKNGQEVWVSILTEYTNAPPQQDVSEAVYEHGRFRDAYSDNTLRGPTHWMPRERPAPPLPAEVGP